MPLSLKPLTQLDPAAVDSALAETVQRLAELLPAADWKLGVLHDVVLLAHAALEAALADAVATLEAARSLKAIAANPLLADPATVDAVLSNFRVVRQAGTPARGLMTILLQTAASVTVPRGSVFTTANAAFTVDQAYATRLTVAELLGPGDVLLAPVPDGSGRFFFTVAITALLPGPAGLLRRGNSLTPAVGLPRFDSAHAAADFQGGVATETNAQLVQRLADGAAVQAPSNRLTTGALVRAQPAFAAVTDISEAGAGDPEQLRVHSLFPVASGGKVDLYVRSAPLPLLTACTVLATQSGLTAAGSLWQLSLPRDLVPGFYEVAALTPAGSLPGSPSFAVVSDQRSFDLSGSGWHPDIQSVLEAAYTRYQTAVVTFLDPTGSTRMPTRWVDVTVRLLPLLDAVHDFLTGRDVRPPAADLLVRAAVPCFVSAFLTVRRPAAAPLPDVGLLQSACAQAVNQTGFPGRLAASLLTAAVYQNLPAGLTCSAVQLLGRLRYPDGFTRSLRSSEELVVPDEPARLVSARTVCFFLDPADVDVALLTTPADA